MVAQIKLKDGRIVSADEHYAMLCKKHGLSGTKHIKRDPNNRERWIEYDAEYIVLEPKDAELVQDIASWLEEENPLSSGVE